jgi:hypothetical protein
MQAQGADNAAHAQLQDSWNSVEHEFGLLVARISDSNGFVQLARLDAKSADLDTNHSAICSQGGHASEIAMLAINRSLQQGYAMQTWRQVTDLLEEMLGLQDRFYGMGLKTPSNDTLVQGLERAANAFVFVADFQPDIAIEAVRHACDSEYQSALLQAGREAETRKLGDLEAAVKSLRDAEKQKDLVIKQNLQQKDFVIKQNEEALRYLHDSEAANHRVLEENRELQETVLKLQAEKLHQMEEKMAFMEKAKR